MNDNDPAKVLVADFKKRVRVHLGGGLYQEGAIYLERPYIDGRQTWRKLNARTERLARVELGKNRADQALSRRGLATDPYKPQLAGNSIAFLCDYYLSNGCPKRKGKRTPQTLREEKTRVATLSQYWGKKLPADVTAENQTKYRDWRLARLKRKASGESAGRGGLRQVDKELITLSNIFRWAVLNQQKTGVTKNPLRDCRLTFQDPDTITHCRDRRPENAEQIHAVARYLLHEGPRSEVFAWFMLFQHFTAQRAHEVCHYRLDAKYGEPGYFLGKDGKVGKCFFHYRSSSSKGTHPHSEIFPLFRECIEAFLLWHRQRYGARSPWFFPSPEDPSRPVAPGSLTQAFRRVCPAVGIDRPWTSHSMRSWKACLLLSHGMAPGIVASMLGQRSGERLIITTYGEPLPYKLQWRPETGTPAWSQWLATPQLELEF